MEEKDKSQAAGQEQDPGEEPQVYGVKKGLGGWEFSRRELLAAAATAAAAVTVAAVAQKDQGRSGHEAGTEGAQSSVALDLAALTMLAVSPAQSFVQFWRFTNQSDGAWARGAKLFFSGEGERAELASLPVPEIAPGRTHTVTANRVAPGEPGVYRSTWQLQASRHGAALVSGPLVVVNGCIAESPHPYEDNMTADWVVTNPDESAQNTRVHFSQVEVLDGDAIILRDEGGTEIQRISGKYPLGFWSNPIPGRVVNLELNTDASEVGWGFCLDMLETGYHVYLPYVTEQPTPTPTPIVCLVESPHPYSNDMLQTYIVTNPDPSAPGSRVHFSQVELETNYDYVNVQDSAGWVYQRITGAYPTGLWSAPVVGRNVYLIFDTDGSITRWGFCVDQIETTAAPCSCVGHCSCDTVCTCDGHCTCDTVCSCVGHCSCDTVCTCDTVHYWYPN